MIKVQYVILVTGTRDLEIRQQPIVTEWLETIWDERKYEPREAMLIHGQAAQPKGKHWEASRPSVDVFAGRWAKAKRIQPWLAPANWENHPAKTAGHVRNEAMVNLCATLALAGVRVEALAFPRGKSVGTRDCIRRIESAKIPLMITELEP